MTVPKMELKEETAAATMPNFLIIGAAKSGTTSLYHYLRQHPQIYMSPVKEPKFFALAGEKFDYRGPGDQEDMQHHSITNIETYHALFEKAFNQSAIGEASTLYLYSPKAAAQIRRYIPEAKLIAILRHPVDRAYSNFLYMVRRGNERLRDFTLALQEEEARIRAGWMPSWHYRQRGFYYTQLKRYFDIFSRDQIKVYLFEDLTTHPTGLMRNIFQFLGVDNTFTPNISTKHNISGLPKNEAWHNFFIGPNPIKTAFRPFMSAGLRRRVSAKLRNQNLVKPPLSPETRRQLIDLYRSDILQLQELIRRDLSQWLEADGSY
jgi:hypothetical protein